MTSPAASSPLPSRERHTGIAPHRCGECCTVIEGLSVDYGAGPVLQDIHLHLHCGELTAIIGPNGAGKSTLLKTLLGEIPFTGRVQFRRVFGAEENFLPAVGYVPQQLAFDRQSPIQVLDLFTACLSWHPTPLGAPKPVKRQAKEVLGMVGAGELLHRRLGTLSGGELQRVLLALALTPPPNLLLLDEPVSSIDLAGREHFYQLVSELRRRLDLSIVLVSHDLAGVVPVADRLVFLNRKIVHLGPPREVLAHPEVRHTFALDVEELL